MKDPCDCKFVGILSLKDAGQTLEFNTRAVDSKDLTTVTTDNTTKHDFPLKIIASRDHAPSFFAAPSWRGSLTGRLYDMDPVSYPTTVSLTVE
jgi:hypothetical protein